MTVSSIGRPFPLLWYLSKPCWCSKLQGLSYCMFYTYQIDGFCVEHKAEYPVKFFYEVVSVQRRFVSVYIADLLGVDTVQHFVVKTWLSAKTACTPVWYRYISKCPGIWVKRWWGSLEWENLHEYGDKDKLRKKNNVPMLNGWIHDNVDRRQF